ncbi:MAG TPA: hypothetical protein VKR31_03885 [Rhizomicrobium sp.]|nr:hypothetical protein [Rhizomicrobium sp.]
MTLDDIEWLNARIAEQFGISVELLQEVPGNPSRLYRPTKTAAVPVVTANQNPRRGNYMFASLLRRIRQYFRGDVDTITSAFNRLSATLQAHADDAIAASSYHAGKAEEHDNLSDKYHADAVRALKIAGNVSKLLEA